MISEDRLYEILDTCGEQRVEIIDFNNGHTFEVPKYCDNRVCENPDCQEHRLYKYMKEHKDQIHNLNRNMRKPKAWVFTDKHIKMDNIDRGYLKSRLRFLYNLLDIEKHPKYGARSFYSIHMELKVSKTYNYTTVYLHFHVVSANIKNLTFIRAMWKHRISFEKAIKLNELGFYISKYASKTPFFPSNYHLQFYFLATYKLQMHRFNVKIDFKTVTSELPRYGLFDLLLLECRRAIQFSNLHPSEIAFNLSTWRDPKSEAPDPSRPRAFLSSTYASQREWFKNNNEKLF